MTLALRAAVLVALVLALMASPEQAGAGEYTISVCQDGAAAYGASFTNGTFAGSGSTRDSCDSSWGLETSIGGGATWPGQGGALNACAPPGTRFVSYRLELHRHWQGSGYSNVIDTGACGGYAQLDGGWLDASLDTVQDWTVGRDFNSTGLRLLFECRWMSPCNGNWGIARYKNIRLTVHDDLGGPGLYEHAGLWNATGWVRGTQSASFKAEDNVGVARMRVEVDPASNPAGWPWDQRRSCDYARIVPCETGRVATSYDFDTTRVGNGTHTLRYSAQDTGGVWATADSTFKVDNTAPTATLSRASGSLSRTVTWNVSDSHSGVNGASLGASYSTNNGASWQPMPGTWNTTAGTYTATVPADIGGQLQVRIDGRDNASPGGNAINAGASAITVDNPTPQPPSITVPQRWLNRSDPTYYDVQLALPGVAGFSVTRDGSAPDASVDQPGSTAVWRVADLPDGATTIKARAVSGAGVASDPAEAVIRMDRELPTAKLRGAGRPDTPHPGPVTVTLGGHDAVSGIDSVAYRLDGAGGFTQVDGDEALIAVSDTGAHTLEYFAVDTAGNRSATEARSLTIGGSAPLVGAPRARFAARTANPDTRFAAAKRFGDPCPVQVTLSANRAATIAEQDANARSNGTLRVAPPSRRSDALIGFSLPAAADCTVASAVLRLQTASGAGRPVQVRRASSSWAGPAVSWNTRPGVVGTEVTSMALTGWTEWDVTAQVQALYTYGDNGLYLRDAGPDDPSGATALTLSQPQLVVRFSE